MRDVQVKGHTWTPQVGCVTSPGAVGDGTQYQGPHCTRTTKPKQRSFSSWKLQVPQWNPSFQTDLQGHPLPVRAGSAWREGQWALCPRGRASSDTPESWRAETSPDCRMCFPIALLPFPGPSSLQLLLHSHERGPPQRLLHMLICFIVSSLGI